MAAILAIITLALAVTGLGPALNSTPAMVLYMAVVLIMLTATLIVTVEGDKMTDHQLLKRIATLRNLIKSCTAFKATQKAGPLMNLVRTAYRPAFREAFIEARNRGLI